MFANSRVGRYLCNELYTFSDINPFLSFYAVHWRFELVMTAQRVDTRVTCINYITLRRRSEVEKEENAYISGTCREPIPQNEIQSIK